MQPSSDPRVVLALRQSPDWWSLALAYARGVTIRPEQFLPHHPIPTFPPGIERYIDLWNATFALDFFTVRAALKDIAHATRSAVAGAILLNAADLPNFLPADPFRVFPHDDDDWFAPDTAARLRGTGAEDVSVFPMPRIGVPPVTFARQTSGQGQCVGSPTPRPHRYHTNNYALHPRLCVDPTLRVLIEHKDASAAADALGLIDCYHDVMVSATNKTPVAASVMEMLPLDAGAFRREVGRFVAMARTLVLPDAAAWMAEPLSRTSDLFTRVMG